MIKVKVQMRKIFFFIPILIMPLYVNAQWSTIGSDIYYNSGDVGIGLNTPSHKLHVYSTGWKARFSGPEGYIDIGPNNSNWAHIYTDRPKFIFNKDVYTLTGGFSSYSTNNFFLKTNGSTRLTILNSNGFVGIGTNTPASKLHVTHTGRTGIQLGGPSTSVYAVGDLKFQPSDNNSVGGAKYWNWSFRTDSWSSAPGDFVLYSHDGNSYTSPIIFQSDGDLLLTTGNGSGRNGNVGIGTITPDFKLDVLGTIRATEVKVATGWSDFVFESNYNLKSLDQVKVFINNNGHLPDIPSAKDIAENGISLGKMDALLLQKIEELTLYVIEQQLEIKKLKTENESQNRIINDLKN